MEKTTTYSRFDFMGTDTYGWPLPARWTTSSSQKEPSAIPLHSAEQAIRPELPPIAVAPTPSVLSVTPDIIETPMVPAEPHKFIPPPAVFVDVQPVKTASATDGPAVGVVSVPPGEASDYQAESTLPIIYNESIVSPCDPFNNPSVTNPTAYEERLTAEIQMPQDTDCSTEAPMVIPEPSPRRQLPRFQTPSPFEHNSQHGERRPSDFWANANRIPELSDWRRVIEASTLPDDNAIDLTIRCPSGHNYPPISVEHPNDLSGRQALRLYVGEKSALTLAQTYLYNSICFEESCPQLSSLMGRLASDAHTLAQMLGKLAFAFGIDPRPRMMQSQRGQYWNGNYVQCIRNPRRAVLALIELERGLLGEFRRFGTATRDPAPEPS